MDAGTLFAVAVFSMAAFFLQWLSGAVPTQTVWPTKTKIFVIWSFIEKDCQPLVDTLVEEYFNPK